jgi:spore coat protein JB
MEVTMKNNFYNIKEDWYKEFNNNFNLPTEMNLTNINNLANPKEGFLRGNLFNNLYDPYKNYKYTKLNPTNKKEEMLFNILMYKFALKELNLYLDNFPNNTQILNLYNQYLLEEKKLCNQYQKNYGPLTIDSENIESNNWKWIKSPWPWEGTK